MTDQKPRVNADMETAQLHLLAAIYDLLAERLPEAPGTCARMNASHGMPGEDGCPCVLARGHGGLCACTHTAEDFICEGYRENVLRGDSAHVINGGTCKAGHVMDEENTYRRPGTNWTDCRACHRDRQAKRRSK